MAEVMKTARMFGRHIISDPNICHGEPTFRGTRILVSQVLEQVATGMSWDAIAAEWRGAISKAGIAEAVQLARTAFLEHADQYVVEATAA